MRRLIAILLVVFVVAMSIVVWQTGGQTTKPDVAAAQENGRAVEPRVVDALPARTSVDDEASPPESEPRRTAGEVARTAEVEVAADGRELPIVTGRFVRNDGTPWVSTVVAAHSWFVPGAHHTTLGELIETDAEGRFRMVVRVPRAHDERRGFHLRIADSDGTGTITGQLDLSRELVEGVNELGDVRLDHGIALASGRVLDRSGAVVPRAHVRVEVPYRNGGNGRRSVLIDGLDTTGADGEFEVFARAVEEFAIEALEIRAQAPGFVPSDATPFRFGAQGIELVLTRSGAIAGSVRLLTDQIPDDVVLRLSGGGRGDSKAPAADGGFAFADLPPGSYSVEAALRVDSRASGDGDAIRVEDVFVVAGETTRDPRLQGITINATSTRVAIKVVDESSQPIARATVRVAGDGRGGEARSDTKGVAVLRGRELPFDAEVDAFGFRPAKLYGVDRDREVVLRRGISVVLVSSMPAHGTEPRYDLGLRLHAVDAEGRPGHMLWPDTTPLDRLFFDGTGELRLDLPAAGRYRVDVFVFVSGRDNVGRGGNLGLDPSLTIDVQESTASQRVRVEIPKERVREMLERLGR